MSGIKSSECSSLPTLPYSRLHTDLKGRRHVVMSRESNLLALSSSKGDSAHNPLVNRSTELTLRAPHSLKRPRINENSLQRLKYQRTGRDILDVRQPNSQKSDYSKTRVIIKNYYLHKCANMHRLIVKVG